MKFKNTFLVKQFLEKHNYACPGIGAWPTFFEVMGSPKSVPIPLILGGWVYSSTQQKKDRFILQIEYAAKDPMIMKKVSEYLESLKPEDWLSLSEKTGDPY